MKKKDREHLFQWFLILSSFLFGSLVTLFFVLITSNNKLLVENNIEKALSATVYIETEKYGADKGTGFIYKIDRKYAYILTNEHVVTNDKVYITNSKNKKTTGEVIGKDQYIDLAIVKIKKEYAPNKLNISKTKKIKVGEIVYAIGNPINEHYNGTVTSGIISGVDREVRTTIDEGTESWIMKALQFDAHINLGSSGGPLINQNGEVIGICTMKLIQDGIEGMNFATSNTIILENLKTLESGKKIKRVNLGITVKSIEDIEEDLNGKEIKEESGVLITKISDNSIAKKNDLKTNDIILEINGIEIDDKAKLKYEIYKYQKGDTIKIKYIRDNKTYTKEIKLK